MSGVVLVAPRFQFFDAIGNPLANGSVDVFLAGTTTRTSTWTDSGLTSLNTNPIVLDGNGSCTMVVDDTLTYKLVVKNSAGATQPHAGGDNITGNGNGLRVALAASSGSSLVGFLQAGSGAVARTLQDKGRERITVPDFATLATTLTARGSDGTRLVVPSGTAIAVSVNTTIPKNMTLEVHEGALITVAVGVTLTVLGQVIAANYEIFDGAGTVNLDNGASEYNLAWFKTTNGYINERWDFAKRGMTSFRTKVVRWPKPREGQAGVFTSGSRNFWYFSAPIIFADAQNTSTHYVECEFQAQQSCAAFMQFDDAAKPENIYFYGPLQANVDSTQNVPIGLDIKAGSRMSFFGQVVLNGFKTSVSLGGTSQTASVEDIYMPRVQFSFFSVAALDIYGTAASTVQNIRMGNVRCSSAQGAGLPVVRMRGLLRDITIDNVYYATNVATSGFLAVDAEDVVLLDSNAEGTIQHVVIGAIYQSTATNGFRTQSSVSNANKIIDISVNRIFGKFNGSAANLDYCQRVTINTVENASDVTIAANASATKISTGSGLRTLTDAGTQTIINGLGQQTRGGGLPPSPAVTWPLGTVIRETSDNRMYLRIGAAATAADFLMIRGSLKGNTASRPTLTTTDVGVMYMDITLDADGKPIWWNGTIWIDATGAAV